jgi:hypothetical protein
MCSIFSGGADIWRCSSEEAIAFNGFFKFFYKVTAQVKRAGDQDRAAAVAILDDFHEIAALAGGEAIRPHESLGYKPPAPEVFVPAFAAWPAALRRSAPPATLTLAQRPTLN